MSNMSNNLPMLNYLAASSPSPLMLAALRHQQQQRQQLLQQNATRQAILGRLMNSMEGGGQQRQRLQLPLQPPLPNHQQHFLDDRAVQATSNTVFASAASASSNGNTCSSGSPKVDRGKSPPVWINGAPVPTKLHNLRLKKSARTTDDRKADMYQTVVDELELQDSRLKRKQELLEKGLLSASNNYPKEFPLNYRPDPLNDVIVNLDVTANQDEDGDLKKSSHNMRFERVVEMSLPSFREAIQLRQGQMVKKIVHSILHAISVNGGAFVTPWVGGQNCWREVVRNDAERFALNELRRQHALFMTRPTVAVTAVSTTQTVAAPQETVNVAPPHVVAMARSSPIVVRRVSPPDLQMPSRATLLENSSSAEDSSESTFDAEDNVQERPKKQAKIRTSAEAGALDALFLLSETAAKVPSA